MTNRGPSTNEVQDSTNSNIAVFAIDQRSAEPNLIQNIDSDGVHPRTFSIDTSGRLLIAGSLTPITLREGSGNHLLPAGLSIFRIGSDGRLRFERRYAVDTGEMSQFWTGLVELS